MFIAETFPKYIELPDDLGEIDTAIKIMVDLQKKVEALKEKNKKLEEGCMMICANRVVRRYPGEGA